MKIGIGIGIAVAIEIAVGFGAPIPTSTAIPTPMVPGFIVALFSKLSSQPPDCRNSIYKRRVLFYTVCF